MYSKLLLGAALACASAMIPAAARQQAPAAALDPATTRAVAERAAVLLETRYVFPETGKLYAAALRDHAARGDYAALTDSKALAERLTADLRAVSPDGHLRFYPVAPRHTPAPGTPQPAAQPPAPGIAAMRWVEPGVAYIAFDHFDDRPEAIAALTRFLTDFAGARALIIDSRGNHGGAFDMLGLLANHLYAEPRLLANMDMARAVVDEFGAPFPIDGKILRRTEGPAGLVRFQHWSQPGADKAWFATPLYYLTSHHTYSAAEHMAMVLKSTHRATLIGETTGGGNHFGGTEEVGAGLELFVPIGHTTDPATGKDWEGTGVAPDIAVPADGALDEALRRIHAQG